MRTPKNWSFCLEMLARVAPPNGEPFNAVEIGCASGGNAASMLRAFPKLNLWMVDPYRADPAYVTDIKEHRKKSAYLAGVTLDDAYFANERYKAFQATSFAAGRRTFLEMQSTAAVGLAKDGQFQFVFIDGDHREQAVAADLRNWWPKTGPGIFSGHDYGTRGHDGVKRAVDAWCAEMGLELHLHPKWARCWWVEKV